MLLRCVALRKWICVAVRTRWPQRGQLASKKGS